MDWLIYKVQIALLYGTAGSRLRCVSCADRTVGIAAAKDLIEQFKIALGYRLGECFGDGSANDLTVTDEAQVVRIGKLKSVLGSTQHGHERRALFEQFGQLPTFGCFALSGEYFLGGLSTDDQYAADPPRRVGIEDRVVVVRPIDLLEPPV